MNSFLVFLTLVVSSSQPLSFSPPLMQQIVEETARQVQLHPNLMRFPAEYNLLLNAMTSVESQYTPRPRRNGTGCGVLQVLPDQKFFSPSQGEWEKTPSCTELEDLHTNIHWAVTILSLKVSECTLWGSRDILRCAATNYNGSKFKDKYATDVLNLFYTWKPLIDRMLVQNRGKIS